MKFIPLLVIPMALVACKPGTKAPADSSAASAQSEPSAPKAIQVTPLHGYFVKNTVAMDRDCQALVLGSQTEFDIYFGVAKTMANEISPVDFEKSRIVAIFTAPSETEKTISVGKAERSGNKLTVHYKIDTGAKRTFTSTALVLFPIPRDIESVVVEGMGNKETISVGAD